MAGNGIRYSTAQWEQMVAVYGGGATLADATRPFGATASGLCLYMKKHGLSRRGGPLESGERNELAAMYASGLTTAEISKRSGRGVSAVRGAARAKGIAPHDTRKYVPRDDYFSVIDTDEKAYWLGFIAADGCVSRTSCLSIGLQVSDREHLEKFRATVCPDAPISLNFSRKSKTYAAYLTVRSKQIVADLARNGIGLRKSLTMPMWDGPKELLPSWFRGLLDGDGTWGWKPRRDTGKGFRPDLGLIATNYVAAAFRDYIQSSIGAAPSSLRVAAGADGKLTVVKYSRLAAIQAIARHLYAGATVSLDRKQAIVDRILVAPLVRKSRPVRADAMPRPFYNPHRRKWLVYFRTAQGRQLATLFAASEADAINEVANRGICHRN